MLLGAIRSCARESALEDAELTDLFDFEPFPPVRGAAPACAADLKDEEKFPVAANAVVVRFDSSRRPILVDQLDEAFFTNRADEIGIDDRQHLASITRPGAVR
jgi:hypothetical protein